MLIKVIDKTAATESEVTPQHLYNNRRQLMEGTIATALFAGMSHFIGDPLLAAATAFKQLKKPSPFDAKEALTPLKDVSSYNNFYEFGTDKSDPARNSKNFKPSPWTLRIDGAVEKPADYALEDFLKTQNLEERIYRLRCVEAWSMVIPWVGFPLADLIKRAKPSSKAKYLAFTTLHNPEQMPGQKSRMLDWPYVEGLRMDEALHPLAFLAVGLYGDILPNQNGAPIRLVVPWKYGFKSIKSIVKISFVESEPKTTWNILAPKEYGFYANVNPKVDHPRWTQAKERRIGEYFKRETTMFNGYEQVASLYTGMDLTKLY